MSNAAFPPRREIVYLPVDAFLGEDSDILLPRRPITRGEGGKNAQEHHRPHPNAKANQSIQVLLGLLDGFTLIVSTLWTWIVVFAQAWNIALALSDIWALTCLSWYGPHTMSAHYLLPPLRRPILPYSWETLNLLEPKVTQHERQLIEAMTAIRRMNDYLGVNVGGGRDLTLHGATAHIIPQLTTGISKPSRLWSPYSSAPPYPDEASPHNIFGDPPTIGQCWRFAGGQGFAAIQLEEPANITAVSLVYPPHERLSSVMVLEAPRLIRLWAVPEDEHQARGPACLSQRRPLSEFAGSRAIEKPLDSKSVVVLLKEVQYKIHHSRVRQVFHVDSSACNIGPYSIVIIDVLENWGAEDTCVYHVGIHSEAQG